jgi:hypothetical protein
MSSSFQAAEKLERFLFSFDNSDQNSIFEKYPFFSYVIEPVQVHWSLRAHQYFHESKTSLLAAVL